MLLGTVPSSIVSDVHSCSLIKKTGEWEVELTLSVKSTNSNWWVNRRLIPSGDSCSFLEIKILIMIYYCAADSKMVLWWLWAQLSIKTGLCPTGCANSMLSPVRFASASPADFTASRTVLLDFVCDFGTARWGLMKQLWSLNCSPLSIIILNKKKLSSN